MQCAGAEAHKRLSVWRSLFSPSTAQIHAVKEDFKVYEPIMISLEQTVHSTKSIASSQVSRLQEGDQI